MFVAKHEIAKKDIISLCANFPVSRNVKDEILPKLCEISQNFAPRETPKIANYEVMSLRQFHDFPQT